MSLTVTEANAVLALTRWLSGVPVDFGHQVTEAEAIEAMELLADHAGRTLQISPDRSRPARIVQRLRAADSDGAAQAVCRAIEEEARRQSPEGRSLRHDSIREPFEAWRRLQDTELGKRLRDQTTGPIDTAWGVVDV